MGLDTPRPQLVTARTETHQVRFRPMRAANLAILTFGTACLLTTFVAHCVPTLLSLAISSLLFIALIMFLFWSGVVGARQWRKDTRWWICPALLCLAFLLGTLAAPASAAAWRERQFVRNHQEYDRIVSGVRDGSLFHSDGELRCDDSNTCPIAAGYAESPLAPSVYKCKSGEVQVWFPINRRVPSLHEGFIFKEYSESSPCALGLAASDTHPTTFKHIEGNWYSYSF